MKKRLILTLLTAVAFMMNTEAQTRNLYDFTVTDIDGKPFDMAQLKGKKVMIVNTASECGFTPQYEILEQLYQKFGDDDFTIIGFPANNFGGQEPGTNEEIKEFCEKNYGVSFPMMSKISVTGEDQHELYQWLTQKEKNGKEDTEVAWNFQKYLIDEEGNYAMLIPPKESPASPAVLNWIGLEE
jgi:glutathione peroxidase